MKSKQNKIVVSYGGTQYIVKDYGENEFPRFALYNQKEKETKMKSDNPLYFDEYMKSVWGGKNEN